MNLLRCRRRYRVVEPGTCRVPIAPRADSDCKTGPDSFQWTSLQQAAARTVLNGTLHLRRRFRRTSRRYATSVPSPLPFLSRVDRSTAMHARLAQADGALAAVNASVPKPPPRAGLKALSVGSAGVVDRILDLR